jgi:hypothetical protein
MRIEQESVNDLFATYKELDFVRKTDKPIFVIGTAIIIRSESCYDYSE